MAVLKAKINGVWVKISGGGGGSQEQADWSEADSTRVTYIKNKPGIASDSTLGFIKVGPDFSILSDGTLVLYTPISIGSLYFDQSTIVELGTIVNLIKARWTLNKEPYAQTFDGDEVDLDEREYNKSGSWNSTTGFTLEVEDERGTTASRTAYLSFYNGVYYGSAADQDVTNSFIQSLSKKLVANPYGTVNYDAGVGEYCWFAYPTSMGNIAFYNNGMEVECLVKENAFSYTNSKGHTETYRVYRTNQHSLGHTDIEVRVKP